MGKRINVLTTTSAATIATTRERLHHLWRLLLAHFLWYLETTPAQDIRADYLAQIRGFLRDSNVDVDALHAKDVQKSLAELSDLKLPFGSNPF